MVSKGFSDIDNLSINTNRFLLLDMVQEANSDHPGLPVGAAPMAYVLWSRFLRFNPGDPQWPNRDRFIFSAGHGSALSYSLLHRFGYNLPLEEIKRFRQIGSKTGRPESALTQDVEVTTGPLRQGFADGVGVAIAEAYLAAKFNRPDYKIIDHYTYGLVSDGDLMEGKAFQTAPLAAHLRLAKLIYLYDENKRSLDGGPSSLTFTEDVPARFRAYGWQTLTVEGRNNLQAIESAIREAQVDGERPTLISVKPSRSQIKNYYLKNKCYEQFS